LLGPFEEEEEGTGVASDIVKEQGEDPDTPGYLRGNRVRRDVSVQGLDRWCMSLGSLVMNPRDRNNSPILV